MQERSQQVAAAAFKLKQSVERRPGAPTIKIPVLRMSVVQSSFTLADITDTDAFRKFGASLATDPAGELSWTLLGARVVTGPDGIRRTELVTSTAADRLRSTTTRFPEHELRNRLAEIVLGSSAVPAAQRL